MENAFELLQRIDFGDIDGLYDRNINEYFVDNNYWEQLIDGRKFFVIGRKGTGKSAIYNWIKSKEAEKGVIVSNLSFKNFPFEKLLKLTDDDFSKPNQYQSVWRNIILSEIAKHIMLDAHCGINDAYKELKGYVEHKFGTDLTDLHKKVTKQTVKTNTGLFIKDSGIGISNSEEKELVDDLSNITLINARLENLIKDYLKVTPTSPYIIQFDQLDDNYTVYIENNEYFQSIISLFKVVYDLNQSFYQIDAPVKVIAYLRSDIFFEINNYDAESARWDMHKLYLNWAIINRSDWNNPALLKLLNKRVLRSIPELKKIRNPFGHIFSSIKIDNGNKQQSVFAYMVRCSFQRPRDIIQFCIKIQEDSQKWKKLNLKNIMDAEKSYSSWLLTEISNEFGPLIKAKPVLYEFLRILGDRFISYDYVCEQYLSYQSKIGLTCDELLDLLYRLGIILNVNTKARNKEYFSITRNEQSLFNHKMSIFLHPGFKKGLHTYSN